jgi:hypothetical protein
MPLVTSLPVWKTLQDHYQEVAHLHMRDLFANEHGRFEKFFWNWRDEQALLR